MDGKSRLADSISQVFRLQMCLLYLGIYTFSSNTPFAFGNTCVTVPVALSNLRMCEGNMCYFTTQATISLDAIRSTSTCLEFISPDDNAISTTLNITLDYSDYEFTSDSKYNTDAPAYASNGICGCPGGSSHSCTSCVANIPFHNTVLCLSGVHNSDQCFLEWLGASGTWCANVGLSYANRFSIIHFAPRYNLNTLFRVQTNDTIWAMEYNGISVEYDHEDIPFNITIISDTTKPDFIPEYVVFDRHAATDYYLLTSEEVNSIDTYEPRKIGWLKTDRNQKVAPNLGSLIQAKLLDCNKNKFQITYPWINIEQFLSERKTKLSKSFCPTCYLLDDEFKQYEADLGETPDHSVEPYYYLKTGWMLIVVDGSLAMVGETIDGGFVPGFTNFFDCPTNITTNVGTINMQTYSGNNTKCHWGSWHVRGNLDGDEVSSDLREGSRIEIGFFKLSGQMIYGFCVDVYQNHTKAYGSCVNPTFNALSWPEHRNATFLFDGNFKKTINHGVSNGTAFMHMATTKGAYEISVSFKDFKIQFENSVIKPRINNAVVNLTHLTLTAQSVTVGGTCFIYSIPADLLITQPIDLSVSSFPFQYELNYPKYNGSATIGIRCHKNEATKEVVFNFNQEINQTDFINETISNPEWHHTIDPSNWGNSVGTLLGGAGSFFGDLLGHVEGGLKWWQYVLMFVEIALFILILVFVIPILFRLIRYFWRMLPKFRQNKKFVKISELKKTL